MVRFKHGDTVTVSLTLPEDYDLVDTLEADNGPWHTIPHKDLVLTEEDVGAGGDYARGIACLEVTQNHPLLRFSAQVVVAPSGPEVLKEDGVRKCVGSNPSILIYGFASDQLNQKVSSIFNYPVFHSILVHLLIESREWQRLKHISPYPHH